MRARTLRISMIWRSNTTTECDYFNDRWLQFRGRSLDQESGNQWTEGIHPDDFDRCLSTYREAFEKREPFEMEYRLMRHDGEYRWIFDKGAPFFSEDDEFQGYIGSCVDVTYRIEAQQVIDAAMQMCGALGVVSEEPVERLYREIRPLRIYEGATEVQQLIIGRGVLQAYRDHEAAGG